ncbi:ABC transporter ATP-binding protein [Paeniglutamicibacter sp. MACA_103]|uniref:ABC transporter ATP-binding protein n=1 Tax=Paeniglutamicibacter sp. MACA_103 TaxID=3377337 RepID=UPI00389375DA
MPAQELELTPALSVRSLSVRFGGLVAVDDVSFDVPAGKVLGLIGPNGAGKTTCFNAITGMVPATGSVTFDGKEILGSRTDAVARAGIARSFQHVAVVPEMTVRENVMIGAHRHGKLGWIQAGLRIGSKKEEADARERADLAIGALGLERLAHRPCSDLGLPNLKLVEIARALAFDASVLLLDEPANGLTHSEVADLADRINDFAAHKKLTIVVVEHHMGLIRSVADHLVVLNFGSVLAEGEPEKVLARQEVIDAYLGVKA